MLSAELNQFEANEDNLRAIRSERLNTASRPATILVVDDVLDYCEEIAYGLSRHGYRVFIATSGREAIDIGSFVRPDVLVTDWMLKDHVHGLAVSEALRLVYPSLQTVLITGFASQDLRVDARVADVFEFLEKPFPMEDIEQAVRNALVSPHPWKHALGIGFVEIDQTGNIVFANYGAWCMLAKRIGSGTTLKAHEIFADDQLKVLEGATKGWVEVSPLGEEKEIWLVRGRKISEQDSTIYVMLNWKNRAYRYSAIVHRLLGLQEPQPKDIQLNGHVLVVDDYEAVRRIAVDILRHFNCICHTAQTHEEAIRLFVHDVDIRHVILDFEMPGSNIEELIQRLRTLRPNTEIIGTSSNNNAAKFAALGVDRFLAKPWEVDQLLQALCPNEPVTENA
ncbi:MAG: response regulator [Bdellovibrionota bacterium]